MMNEDNKLLQEALEKVNELKKIYREKIEMYDNLITQLEDGLKEIDEAKSIIKDFQDLLAEQRESFEEDLNEEDETEPE